MYCSLNINILIFVHALSSIVSSFSVKSLLTPALEVGGLRCLLQPSWAGNSPDFKNNRTTFIATKLDPTGSAWRLSRMCAKTDLDTFSMTLSKSVSHRLFLQNVFDLFDNQDEDETLESLAEFFNEISKEFVALEPADIPLTYDRQMMNLEEFAVEDMLRKIKKPR